MSKKTPDAEIASNLSFEAAVHMLEDLVEAIEGGEISLQESIQRYEEGVTLVKHCRTLLTDAEAKITLLSQQSDGSVKSEDVALSEFEKNGRGVQREEE